MTQVISSPALVVASRESIALLAQLVSAFSYEDLQDKLATINRVEDSPARMISRTDFEEGLVAIGAGLMELGALTDQMMPTGVRISRV